MEVFGGGPCESNAPETDWSPAGFEDRKGHQPPLPSNLCNFRHFLSFLPRPTASERFLFMIVHVPRVSRRAGGSLSVTDL